MAAAGPSPDVLLRERTGQGRPPARLPVASSGNTSSKSWTPPSSGSTPPFPPEPRCCSPPTTACWTCRRQQRIDYAADPALIAGVRHTAGEPRMVHLYLEEDADDAGPGPAPGRLAEPVRRQDLGLHPGRGQWPPDCSGPASRRRAPDRRRHDRRAGCPGPLRHAPRAAGRHGGGGPARLADQSGTGSPAALLHRPKGRKAGAVAELVFFSGTMDCGKVHACAADGLQPPRPRTRRGPVQPQRPRRRLPHLQPARA